MLNKIPNPSRKTFAAFILLSLTLHLAVCRIPGMSSITHEEVAPPHVIEVSLFSVAAPSQSGNSAVDKLKSEEVTELNKIEPASNGDMPAKKEIAKENKSKNSPTSNDNGKDLTTVVKNISEDDYIQTVSPIYPKHAVERGIEGTVVVKALINNKGTAKDVGLLTSSGYEMLDRSALEAVSQWKFKQSALDESIAEMWVQVPVKFIIR